MTQKERFNRTIKVYRTDVKKMKSELKRRMSDIWDIYYFHKDLEELLGKEVCGEYLSAKEVWAEICRTNYFCNKADALLANEAFDFIWVDADEWVEEWNFEEHIEDGLIDQYYMLPDSDEVDEIFDAMKADYKYIVTDIFRFFRFYPLSEEIVIA